MKGAARWALAALRLVSCLAPPAAAFLSAAPAFPAACAPAACGRRLPGASSASVRAQRRMADAEEWVQHDVLGNKMGVLTLNRPKALNAADKSVTGRPAAQLMFTTHLLSILSALHCAKTWCMQ